MHPTPFQTKSLWAAITSLSFLAVGASVLLIGSLVVGAISFLQPVLTPIAVAAILAFLLEPVVRFSMRLGMSRLISIILVYLAFAAFFVGLLVYIIPPAYRQGNTLVKNFPGYMQKTQALTTRTFENLHRLSSLDFLRSDQTDQPANEQLSALVSQSIKDAGNWVQQKIPDLAVESGRFLQRSLGGFLGVFGLLLSMFFRFFLFQHLGTCVP